MKENRWDKAIERLSEAARKRVEAAAERLRGGESPPGRVPVPRKQQLSDYLLLCQPPESLGPDEYQRAQEVATALLVGRDELDLKRWVVAMERLRISPLVGGAIVEDAEEEPPAVLAAPDISTFSSGGESS